MEHVNCEQVREWARQITHEKKFKPFEHDAFYRHIGGCDVCRGALIGLSLSELDVLPPYIRITCTDCSSDLAAFVDAAELAPGTEVSLYPALWWHLLSCQDCADEYIDLRTFARAAHAEADTAQVVSRPIPSKHIRNSALIARFALPRDFLQVALPTIDHQRALVYRGGAAEAHLLAQEDVAPGFQATIGVRQDSAEHWSIVVTIIPPRSGQVLLKLGDLEEQVALDTIGSAIIGPIMSEILLAADGPDIEITIYQDDAP